MENLCTFGTMCERENHLTTYSKTVGIDSLLEMEPDSREILMWTTRVTIINNNAKVCFHHKYVFLKQYPLQQKKFCNPFSFHCSMKNGIFFIWTCVILKGTLMQI